MPGVSSNKPFDPKGKVIVVTGAGSGIGQGLCIKFASLGAKFVGICDIDMQGSAETLASVEEASKKNGHATVGSVYRSDVAKENDARRVIEDIEAKYGPIDMFVANAGIATIHPADKYLSLVNTTDDEWKKVMDINFMQIVYAARFLVPRMLRRGGGHFLITASAAGLLTMIGDAPYAVSKHAAVAYGEWLSVTYGQFGLNVTVLTPAGVATKLTAHLPDNNVVFLDGSLSSSQVADAVMNTLAEGKFLVFPHPEVSDYWKGKVMDVDQWIVGSRKLQKNTTGKLVPRSFL